MHVLVVGLNHKTAPVALREALALPAGAVRLRLPEIARLPGAREAVVLSTCNRVEVYAAGDAALEPGPVERFLAGLHPSPPEDFARHLFRHRGADAARHLFEVASSIDSLVVGETEILGQVKGAYQLAQEAGTVGRVLHAVFQRALAVAKRVHSTTRLGARKVSVGSVAAEFAERIFASLAEKTVLVLGAGEMAEATLHALRAGGAGDLRVANRTPERARDLAARTGGRPVPFDALAEQLPAADVVVCCTAADAYVLGREALERALRARRNRPVVVVDIAVPRNVDPAAGALDNLYLFNIDDLESVVKANLAEREREIDACRPLLDQELAALRSLLETADLGPLIARMREAYQRLGEEELRRLRESLPGLTDPQRAALEDGLRRVVGRFVHDQTVLVKSWAQNGETPRALEALDHLLRAAGDPAPPPGPGGPPRA